MTGLFQSCCGFSFLAGLVTDDAELKGRKFPFGSGRDSGGEHRKRCRVKGALVLCLLSVMPAGVSRAGEPEFDIDIPAMNAAEALNRLAEQTGSVMLFSYDLARAREANAVRGRYTLLEGLELLLRDTGLSGGLSNKRVVTIAEEGSMKAENGKKRGWIAGLVAALGTTAAVDGKADQANEAETRPTALSEIVVTAQKRPERLIDVPQSMSILSDEELGKLGASQFRDFAGSVPGLSFQTTGAGFTQITLRGVTTGFDVGPTVAVYVDEVPYGSSTAFALGAQQALDVGLFDVDHIEVLRGPQGTLYGASTMGGLIKYVTNPPDSSGFATDAQVGVSSTQDGGFSYDGAIVVNAPIARDSAALRLSGFFSHEAGYIDNLALDDSDADTAEIYGGRVDFLFTPNDALDIRIGAYLQNIERDGQTTVEYLAGTPQFGNLNQFRLFKEQADERLRLASATVTYDFGPTTLTSISSYQSIESENIWDISAVYVPLLQFFLGRTYGGVKYPLETETYKFTQEIRLATAEKQNIEWIIGGFYTNESNTWNEEFLVFDPAGNPAPNDLYTFGAPSDYEESAAFGDLTWHFTESFDMTGGIRYANNQQDFTQFGDGLFIGDRPTGESDEDVTTYLANARYLFNDRMMGYVRYATGYRPGGPNAAANDPVTGEPLGLPTFEADRLASYEIGLKLETEDHRFGMEAALYDIDWDDIQVLTTIGGFAFRANANSGATIRGGELLLTANPTSNFKVTGTIAYQDAEISEAEPVLGANEGERLPNVPLWTAGLNADYEFATGNLRPTIGARLLYVDDRTTGFGDLAPTLPEYTTVDLYAGLQFEAVGVQLYIRNLLDERGQVSLMLPQFGPRIAVLEPLTIGINLTTRF